MTTRDQLLDAAIGHAEFDGWSDATIRAAIADCGLTDADAKVHFPRGPIDLALAYHARGDAGLEDLLQGQDLSTMRFRDRIAYAVRARLQLADKPLVRSGMALFALPQNAAQGSRALWQTSSLIWDTLGDTSRDINWYTKRTTLSAVYSSTTLFWLGDQSEADRETWEFLDRRIENVMSFEKLKAQVNKNPLVEAFMNGPGRLLDHVRAPASAGQGGHGGHGGPEGAK